MQHPSFQSLFTMEWVADLKAKIKSFIHGHSSELGIGGPKSPLLTFFMQKQHGGNGPPSNSDEDSYERLQQM